MVFFIETQNYCIYKSHVQCVYYFLIFIDPLEKAKGRSLCYNNSVSLELQFIFQYFMDCYVQLVNTEL